jgi:hypothetical protein
MVLTTFVSNPLPTRRRVLGLTVGAAVAVPLSGCGIFGDEPEPTPPPDPLQPLLDEALAMAAAYDRVVLANPDLGERLTPLAEDHRAHAAELTRLIGAALPAALPSSAAPAAESATLATLRKAEQAAQRTAVAACKTASADRVMLVASIAACRATHAEALS